MITDIVPRGNCVFGLRSAIFTSLSRAAIELAAHKTSKRTKQATHKDKRTGYPHTIVARKKKRCDLYTAVSRRRTGAPLLVILEK